MATVNKAPYIVGGTVVTYGSHAATTVFTLTSSQYAVVSVAETSGKAFVDFGGGNQINICELNTPSATTAQNIILPPSSVVKIPNSYSGSIVYTIYQNQ